MLKFLENNETINNYKKIFPFVKPYWKRALVALGLAIPIGCLDAVIALSLKPYMDIVMVEKTVQSPWYIPLLIIAFTSIQGLLNYASTYTNDWVTMKVTNDLKKALYNKLMHKSSVYYDTKTSGDSLKRFNNDADTACNGLLGSIKMIVSRVFSSISLIGVLIYNSWQLSIIAIFMLGLAIIPLSRVKSRIKSVTNKSESENAVVITSYNEAYGGSKVIKAYSLYDIQNDKFAKQLENLFKLRIKITQKTGSISPLMHVIVSVGIGLAIGYGSHLIQTGVISSGNFVSFITALIMLYTPIKGLGGNVKGMQTSLLALERVMKNLEAKLYIIDKPDALTCNGIERSIEFENVSFEYKKDKPVLKNINFKVNKGETIALVGNSGGGKSTIISLIPRFYKIKQGAIKIDDINIADFKIESLRNCISIVLQNNFLFSGTIKENILMGKPNATEDELSAAIDNACLRDFISSLENGIETEVGENGARLSGGQKQRVAIARAFIKNAPIVILDEATSALDNQSEAIVQKAIDNLMKDKTVFVIAHRLSTIQNADRILVINEGELVETGTHRELMSIENGQYKKLYDMQFKKEEISV